MLDNLAPRLMLAASLAVVLTASARETDPDSAQGSDQDFVAAAALSGEQEVYDAGVATMQSRMEAVRRIAAMLLQDHRVTNARLASLTTAKGLKLPATAPSPSPTHSFSDPEYVSGQIQNHEDAIALFKSEAANGADREFRSFAAQTLPLLERHLRELRALQTP